MPVPPPPYPARANGFTFLRLVLALAVVVGHAFLLGGFGSDPVVGWSRGLLSLHEMALQGFFILSGCLLTRSLATHPSLRRFALRRCFRILPGYWFALIVITFGVAPGLFACLYPERFSYLESLVVDRSNALVYLSKNALLWSDHHRITPLFFGNPVPAAINGSIWTIF